MLLEALLMRQLVLDGGTGFLKVGYAGQVRLPPNRTRRIAEH
jgi:hypothetical protein